MDTNNLNLRKEFILNFFIIICAVSFIFFSGLKYEYFQFRLIILGLLFISIYKFYYELINKDFTSLKIFLFFFLLLIFQFLLNLNNESFFYSNHILFGYIFFYLIFIITYFHTLEINKQLNKILLVFYFTLIISSVLGILLLDHSRSPIFCGGIPINYLPFDFVREIYFSDSLMENKSLERVRLTFDEFIFNENSHLGMIAPGCIIFSMYQISKNKTNIWFNTLFYLFIIICVLKNSTTLMMGTVCSLIFILFFNYKYFSKYLILIFTLIVFIFSSIIYFSQECNSRFIPLYYKNDITTEEINKKISSEEILVNEQNDEIKFKGDVPKEILVSIGMEKKYAYMIADFFHKKDELSGGSLSSAIYFNSLSVAIKSIMDKPFGWGINGYENAFKYYNYKFTEKINLQNRNSKDASNNLVKIIVEFGILGILFYFFLIIINYSKSLPIEIKLIYIPIIITQSIRGAGYFNGGFILIVFLLIFSYIKFYKYHK